MKREDFEREYDAALAKALALTKWSQRLSALRFLAFLLFFGGLGLVLAGYGFWGYGAAAVFGACFVGLLFYHGTVRERLLFAEGMAQVFSSYLDRFGDEWQHFNEDGSAFLREEDTVLADLDILGPRSLFQFLSVAETGPGKERLASLLRGEPPQGEGLRRRQEAVAELAAKPGFSFHLNGLSRLFAQRRQADTWSDFYRFIEVAEAEPQGSSRLLSLCAVVLPAVTLLAFALLAAGKVSAFFPVGMVILQWSFAGFGYRRNMRILGRLHELLRVLQAYERYFAAVEQADVTSPHLREIRRSLAGEGGAARALKRLAAIGEAMQLHYNPLLYAFAAGFLLWDYQCMIAFSLWQKRYRSHIRHWVEEIGELEALLSLAVLPLVKENTSYPALLEEGEPRLSAVGIVHPLLAETVAVGNDCDWRRGTYILAGSNMSGKTTFLRTLGMNLLLAYAGAPVTARSFAAAPLRVFTSMRVGDDVTKGISTFYGELLRIKEMVVYSEKNEPMLALIDEIFKGTNSADRIVGAGEAIRRLSLPQSLTVVSTHDFELCDLESDPTLRVRNYHFREFYEGDALRFDYLLRQGRCKTTNARHLLRLAGILRRED